MHPRPIWKILYTIQDTDDKTVFGYVCYSSFGYPPMPYDFESEEVSETKEAFNNNLAELLGISLFIYGRV